MNLEEIHKSISAHLPEESMGIGAIVVCLVALKLCRGAARWILVLVALGLLAGAVWVHWQRR